MECLRSTKTIFEENLLWVWGKDHLHRVFNCAIAPLPHAGEQFWATKLREAEAYQAEASNI